MYKYIHMKGLVFRIQKINNFKDHRKSTEYVTLIYERLINFTCNRNGNFKNLRYCFSQH